MATFEEIPLGQLRFDPANPRFPRTDHERTLEDVLRFMLKDAGTLDLMRSIAQQGFFPGEPILVTPDGDEFIVVEGNRRLAACLLLSDPAIAPTRGKAVASVAAEAASVPESIPSLVFETRAEIMAHLGYRHVTGIKEWDPLAKANFLRESYDSTQGSQPERLKMIARSIGSRADYVGRLLTALTLYERIRIADHFGIDGLNEETIEFSLISSVLAYRSLTSFLGLESAQDIVGAGIDTQALENLTRWVFERKPDTGRTRLGESRNIGVLADVVSDERALTAFREGASLQSAAKIGGAGRETFRTAVRDSYESLQLAHNVLDDLSDPKPPDLAQVEELRALAKTIRDGLQEMIDGED